MGIPQFRPWNFGLAGGLESQFVTRTYDRDKG
jgi:hypothetical protein